MAAHFLAEIHCRNAGKWEFHAHVPVAGRRWQDAFAEAQSLIHGCPETKVRAVRLASDIERAAQIDMAFREAA